MQSGNPVSQERFDRLYRQYADEVLRLAYFYLGDRQQAEDVMQDVFVRLYTKGQDVAREKEKAWLMTVTVNRCRDHWRSAWMKRVLRNDEVLKLIPSGDDEKMDQRLERDAVLQAVHKLPPDFREVVLLHYYQELTIEQIAEALHISKGTAASRLSRGRDTVKQALKEDGWNG